MNPLLCSKPFFGSQTINHINYELDGNIELKKFQCYKSKVLYGICLMEFGYQSNI